jgi:hypothetical protein
MAFVVADRVKETTTTAGTGTVTLAGAVAGFQAFSAVGNGNSTYYTIVDNTNNTWEVGIGTYTLSGTTLSRDTVLSSSSGGSLVSFAAGEKDVFLTYPAGRSYYGTGNQSIALNNTNITENTTVPATSNGLSVGPITIANSITLTVANNQKWIVL